MVTQIALATPWLNPSIGGLTLPGSPDYFNQCASGSVSVPYNFFGYQTAHSGKGYSGICLWSGEPPEVREYLEVPINSLTSGITYYFQMYINLANNCQHSTDAVGVYFSDTSIINIPNYYPLPFIPQINNVSGNYLDTLNWKIVSGSYTALGGESFLLIGNFNADSTTSAPLVNSSAQFNSAYSYIDDVSLTICTGILNESMFVSLLTYPNPFSNQLTITTKTFETAELSIYNAISERVLNKSFINSITINTENLAKGMYLYDVLIGNGLVKKGKIIKE